MLMATYRSCAGALAAATLLFAGSALAQPVSYTDVPDRFRIEAGGFRIGAATDLTFHASGGVISPVDFESLSVPTNATRFYIEGFFRPWRRHQFSLAWYSNNRDGEPTTTARDFTWGDRVITAGASVTAHVNSNYLSGVYRFAAYKNDRFEIGPAIGVGHLSLTAEIDGQLSVTGAAGTLSTPFDVSKSLGQITGDFGGYFSWWAIKRLLVRGDFRYIYISPENSTASITDGRAAAVYHPWRNIGIGLQYSYTKFRYDRDILSTELGGSLRYSGAQLVFSGAF